MGKRSILEPADIPIFSNIGTKNAANVIKRDTVQSSLIMADTRIAIPISPLITRGIYCGRLLRVLSAFIGAERTLRDYSPFFAAVSGNKPI